MDHFAREDDNRGEKSLGRVAEHLKVHAVDVVESAHLLLADLGKVTLGSLVLPLDLEEIKVPNTRRS